MDMYWYALVCIFIGGMLGIVVPYLFKVMDETVKFSYSYLGGLCISMFVAAIVLVPDPVPELTGQMVMMLVLAGFGIQVGTNLLTSKVRKRIATNAEKDD